MQPRSLISTISRAERSRRPESNVSKDNAKTFIMPVTVERMDVNEAFTFSEDSESVVTA